MRHTDWCRIRWTPTSDPGAAAALIPLARTMLGQMMQGLQLVGQRTGILRRELPDGSTITVRYDGTTPMIDIDVPPEEAEEPRASLFNLWVPRGFVVYPAWSGTPFGVGLPIINDDTIGPYAPGNLSPGIDPARWTPGGPCGEVLVSPDQDAGYPLQADIPVPLLYHPTKGPVFRWNLSGSFDDRDHDGPWQAYRLELARWVAHYADEDIAQQQVLFEGVNAARATSGTTAATLRPRGLGRPAEIMASIMDAAGSTDATSPSYPATYTTPANRLTKDGYTIDWAQAAFPSFARDDLYGLAELRAAGDAAAALSAWNADPDAQAALTAELGRAVFCDQGYRNGKCAVAIMARDRWLEAGNQAWQSSDLALPPLSWHGFASVNLAWETYPAVYDRANRETAPLVPVIAFTTANGDPWLTYPRSTAPTTADVEPAMGRHIYCRGRSIALAPQGALVWGACAMPVTKVVSGTEQRYDRLVLLAHHPADQAADYTAEGWTRYLRVWWADVPRRALAIDPMQVIVGTDIDDALAWRGGTLIDVGHMPPPSTGGTIPPDAVSSLKYASQWRFSPDGSRAVCLRDYGLMTDYSDLVTSGLAQFDGRWPRAVELVFSTTADDMTVTTVWHDYTAGAFASTHDTGSGTEFEFGALPVAVDYSAGGDLLYAYRAQSVSALAGGSPASGSTEWTYVGIGTAAVRWASDLAQHVQVAASKRTTTQDFRWTGFLQVADVRSAAFVVEGMHPELMAETLEPNPTYISCWPFTESLAHGVRMVRAGALMDERWYPIPDGAVVAPLLSCDVHDVGANAEATYLPLAASANVQTYWAERWGQYVFAYQVSPLPQAVPVRDNDTPDGLCECTVSAWDIADRTHSLAFSELAPRGGHAMASVPMPDHDWLIYTKVL